MLVAAFVSQMNWQMLPNSHGQVCCCVDSRWEAPTDHIGEEPQHLLVSCHIDHPVSTLKICRQSVFPCCTAVHTTLNIEAAHPSVLCCTHCPSYLSTPQLACHLRVSSAVVISSDSPGTSCTTIDDIRQGHQRAVLGTGLDDRPLRVLFPLLSCLRTPVTGRPHWGPGFLMSRVLSFTRWKRQDL